VVVVDASALAPALADDGPEGDVARARLRGESLTAPELIDLETTSVIRRQLLSGQLDARRAEFALGDLTDLPLRRAPHLPLLPRCWELRQNITVYDAAYVALAELLDVVLITGDARLANAPGPRCRIDLLACRKEVLVQLDEELVERLDRLAARQETNRSELLRRGAAAVLAAAEIEAADDELRQAYRRIPQDPALVRAAARLAAQTAPMW